VSTALDGGRAGVLVPPGDAAALASAIDVLLTTPDNARALGARARERAVAEYDLRSMVRRYRSIYDELLPTRTLRFTTHAARKSHFNEGTSP
jgi:glycosyltransferase involved in cell wall biosynthesis